MKNWKQPAIVAFIGLACMGYALKPSPSPSPSPMETIFKQVSAQTVLLTDPAGVIGGGTGFAIKTAEGRRYTMTNAHVCRMTTGNYLRGLTEKGGEYRLNILSISKTHDLCILDPIPGKEGLTLASSFDLGQTLYIVGHPHLLPNTPSSGLYTYKDYIDISDPESPTQEECYVNGGNWKTVETVFGAFNLCVQKRNANFTNAAVYPGNSGSPVTDSGGFVVGVVFAGNGVLGYFVPREYVEEFLNNF